MSKFWIQGYRTTVEFSTDDVHLLREVADAHAAECGEDWHEDVGPIRNLADRIAALFPEWDFVTPSVSLTPKENES